PRPLSPGSPRPTLATRLAGWTRPKTLALSGASRDYGNKEPCRPQGSARLTKPVTSNILQVLRRVVEDQRARELPDQDLLQRFIDRHDEAAFLALLRRHGPMRSEER